MKEQNAYIKPADYEISKKRKYKNDIYRKENLYYDEAGDYFVCPNGKKLLFAYESKRKSQNGYEITKRNYICEGCSGCPHREKCYKGKYENRKIEFSPTMARQKKEATQRITTDEGILLRMNRSIQVEGAFGVIKQDFAFRRFLQEEKQRPKHNFFFLHSPSTSKNSGTEQIPTVFTSLYLRKGSHSVKKSKQYEKEDSIL